MYILHLASDHLAENSHDLIDIFMLVRPVNCSAEECDVLYNIGSAKEQESFEAALDHLTAK